MADFALEASKLEKKFIIFVTFIPSESLSFLRVFLKLLSKPELLLSKWKSFFPLDPIFVTELS